MRTVSLPKAMRKLARSTLTAELMITEPLQWICAVLGALMVGISKAGITGLSILSVALFTHVFPSSKQASGLVLPLLIFGDIVAVRPIGRTHNGAICGKLMPWTAARGSCSGIL